MAGIKDSFSKGLATINVKTSNFMEENKLKTSIATQEKEIEELKFSIGEIVYKNWGTESFSLQAVVEELEAIKKRYDMIDECKKQIEELAQKEKQVLGNVSGEKEEGKRIKFCPKCGAESKKGYKFCERCGNRLEA